MALELVPLGTLRVQLKPPIEVGIGPAGTRLIVEVASAEMHGDRLRGQMVGGSGADWLIVGPEGTGSIDIRVALRTDDGATIFVHYNGRLDASRGLQLPMTIYVAPRFETGDERYAWLNRIQAIGKGIIHEDFSLDYEWYEVRLSIGPVQMMNSAIAAYWHAAAAQTKV
jgi:hypothetical protein